jgi:uncharacterized protein (DUF169 family)
MTSIDTFRRLGEEIEKRLRLKTFPLAVKMLEKEADVPEEAIRPTRDLSYHVATCQGFSMSRRDGALMAMLKEDMWCSESVIGLGLAEPPQYFLDGHTRYPGDNATLEAGGTWANELPRLEVGKYVGVVSSPLTEAIFEPDVIVLYCDTAQLKILLSAAAWKDGHELTCTVSGKGACVYAIVPVMQHGKCQVTVPCGGDRSFAMSQDDEMIFSFPGEKSEELIAALRDLSEHGRRLPFRYQMMPEPDMGESYAIAARMMGMEWVK